MSTPTPTSGQPFGRYVLLERVASGGMAEVFRALDGARTVAVKRVLPHLGQDEDFLRLFRQEAELGAKLSHPNVVRLLDVGEQDGEPFLTLEFVDGRNLRQVLRRCAKRGESIPVRLAVHVTAQAALGLHHAHGRTDDRGEPLGIVHRDVSPSNLLVSFDGEVKVADFGIARATAYASTTRAGLVRGKASYLSPEQALGRPLDGRSDQFALASVLWEMIVGRRLFPGDSESEILLRVVSSEVLPPSSLSRGLPPAIDAVTTRALARDPGARFPDAAAFSSALTGALSTLGPPVTAPELAQWMRATFRDELASRDEAERTAVTQATPPPDVWLEEAEEPEVEPLPIEERRKLFDLPPPRAVAPVAASRAGVAHPAADEPLELAGEERRAEVERAVQVITVGGAASGGIAGLRLAVVGILVAVALFAGIVHISR